MKKVLVILDGLMERQLEDFSLKELLFGNFDINFKEEWRDFSVKGKELDSLNCIMNILGYDSSKIEIGDRAFYEGLSRGIKLKKNQSILRCNIVSIKEGILKDFTGGVLANDIEEILMKFNISNGYLYPCYKYKNLLVINRKIQDKLYPPHFYVGERIDEIFPKDIELANIINESCNFFKERGLEGLALWPWGVSKEIELTPFKEKAGLVSGIDLLVGIGKALNIESIKPKETTGDNDTNLYEKLKISIELIRRLEYVIIHINGFDELAHRKDFEGKVDFINKVNEEFLRPLLEELNKYSNYQLNITCDHRTDSKTGNHEVGNVPFLNIFN